MLALGEMPGISVFSALVILADMGEIGRFASAKRLAQEPAEGEPIVLTRTCRSEAGLAVLPCERGLSPVPRCWSAGLVTLRRRRGSGRHEGAGS